MKYGHNLPFCSLVTALSNGQKRTLAEHKDVAMKLTFDLLHIKLLPRFFFFCPVRHLYATIFKV